MSKENNNKKSHKAIIITSIILILIAILLGFYGYKVYQKQNNYTIDKIISLIENSSLPNNYSLIEKSFGQDNQCFSTINYQTKDNLAYLQKYNETNNLEYEQFVDLNTSSITKVNHFDKTIFTSTTNESLDLNKQLGKKSFDLLSNDLGLENNTYKFYGKEKIDGKKCLKFSFTSNVKNSNGYYLEYVFYVDISNNLIIKRELYAGENKEDLQLQAAETYTYMSFNQITDEQIKKFDQANYEGFKIS